MNHLTTAPGVELFHDAMDVIFDCELGEMQVRRDFFVGHPDCNQGQQPVAKVEAAERLAWFYHASSHGITTLLRRIGAEAASTDLLACTITKSQNN